MKGTEAWEQTGQPRREESWWWAFLHLFKAWVPATGTQQVTPRAGVEGFPQ